jgi:hypothetical protein
MEIMSAYYSRLCKFGGIGCSIVFGASGLLAADLVLQKVPPLTVEQAPTYPQNLARYRLGARVEVVPPNNAVGNLQLSSGSRESNRTEAALLSDDPTVDYALPSGRTTLLVSLSQIENVESISFLNQGAKGELVIATASAKLPTLSAQWHKISQQELTSKSVITKIGPAEAKYVRLTFDLTEPCHIAGLGVYSTAAVSDFTVPRTRRPAIAGKSESLALIGYNLTELHAKARALYVSSGNDLKHANNMIDEQPTSSYCFAADDAAPTALVDLGKPIALRRISALYSGRPGRVDFYVLQSLPGMRSTSSFGGESAPPILRLNEATQENLKPVGSIADGGAGRAAIDFPATTGRYIMVKWNVAPQQDASFSVAEIAAFADRQPADLMASNTGGSGRELIDSDGKTLMDAKDAKDFKEMPAEGPEAPAEGPALGLPDPPPFTFVPEIIPTSE